MRFFSKRQQQQLYIDAKGKCKRCGNPLEDGWHSDHIMPYSKGGETTLVNGQALCEPCNLKKGNKYSFNQLEMKKRIPKIREEQTLIQPEIIEGLRPWQQDFYSLPFNRYLNNHFSPNPDWNAFLLHASVGGGKTRAGFESAKLFVSREEFQVIAISPTISIKHNWEETFRKGGIVLNEKYKFRNDWSNIAYATDKYYQGISLTYATLSQQNNLEFIINIIKNANMKVLLICDEVHHLGDNKSWGDAIRELSKYVKFILNLTGTPYRSDRNPIPNVKYVTKLVGESLVEELVTDYSYSYAQAVRDNVCCPIQFFHLRDFEIGGIKQEILSDSIEDSRKYGALLNISSNHLTNAIKTILHEANNKVNEVRKYMPNAAILVVCDKIEYATNLYNSLPSADASLIVSNTENEDSHQKIQEFKKSNKKWLISVNMISEGVDIPRIRCIVYLSAKTTPLFFSQVSGRCVRNPNVNLVDSKGTRIYDLAYFFMFDYAPLTRLARDITFNMKHLIGEEEFDKMISSDTEFEGTQPLPLLNYSDISVHGISFTENGISTNNDENVTENVIGMCASRLGMSIDQTRHILIEIEKAKLESKPKFEITQMPLLSNENVDDNISPAEKARKLRSEISTKINHLVYISNSSLKKNDPRIKHEIAKIRIHVNNATGCHEGVTDVVNVDVLNKQNIMLNQLLKEAAIRNGSGL